MLLCLVQVYGEFHRVASQNLQYSFFAALDRNTPQLLKLYKRRTTGAIGEKMKDLLMAYEEQVSVLIRLLKVQVTTITLN